MAARNRLRSRSGFAVPRRAPTAVGGRSQARCCTCAALAAVGDRRASVDDRWAGLPVTQRRPWPAEDVWSEPRAAPARCTGAGKRAERFHAASSRPAIRPVLRTPGASAATHRSSKRIPYSPRARAQRGYERSTFFRLAEVVLGRTRPALRRQPHSRRGTARDLREETRQSDTLGVN